MTSQHFADAPKDAWLDRPDAPRPLSEQPVDLVQHLGEMAQARPDDRALIVVRAVAGQVVDQVITYAELDRRTRALAAGLQGRFAVGDRALLLLDNDEHYVVGFLACLYAGLVAVPVFPPESFREQHMARLLAIAQDCEPACVLTSAEMQPLLGAAGGAFGAVPALTVDRGAWVEDPEAASAWQPHRPRPDDLAFLQYTSGSTALPKGVMISHANLMANERAIEEGLSVGADDVFVSWLPLFHDMGLIGGLLQPLHRGIPAVLMTPRFFLEQPLRWLQTISRLRGTISGGPDFAYRLCAERVTDEQRQGLDLSCWRLAFSGAEPVREDTLREFIACFAPVGFSGGAVYPCYGLAEATLFVTGGVRGQGLLARGFSSSGLRAGRAVR
ncbi:MAG: fatty acyl-AMP ligase, partial [Rubrivivax sp.]